MSKAIKIGAGVIGIIVILFIVAVILLVTLVNPNNFKNQISAAVQKNIGRELTIAGDIKWSFFPWLGLRLNQITLGNAPGFAQQQPFAQLSEADIDIRLIPLFRGKVEVGTVTLKDLTVHLTKNAKGQNNWSDLTGNQNQVHVQVTTTTNNTVNAATSNPSTVAAALLISDVDLSNATITWQNEQTGQDATLNNLNLRSSNVNFGKPFPVRLKFHFTSNKPAIDTTIAVSTNVYADPAQEKYALQQLTIHGKLLGNQYASGHLLFSLAANIAANLQQQTLEVRDGDLQVANLHAKTNISGTKILTAPLFQGNVNIPTFNLRTLLTDLGEKVNTEDATAMQSASLQANTEFSPKWIKLSGLHATLDNTTLDGLFNFINTTKTFNFDLKVNQINLDNYASAPSSAAAASAPAPATNIAANVNNATASSNSALLPVALLRQYSGSGSFQIGKLTVNHMTATNIVTQIAAKNGLIQVAPMSAELYQGKSQGSINLDVRNSVPALSMNESLTGVQMEPLLNDLSKNSKIKLTGTGNLTMNILTQGNNANAMTHALNGNIKFAIDNGAIKNIDIVHQIYTVIAYVLKQNTSSNNSNQTNFTSLTGTVNIADGIATNNDLLLKSTAIQVNGNGNANFINRTINYELKTKAVGDPFGNDVFNLQNKIGGSIPMSISGTFSDPKVQPDFTVIATALLKGQVKQEIDKNLPQLEKNLPKNLNQAIKGLQNIFGK